MDFLIYIFYLLEIISQVKQSKMILGLGYNAFYYLLYYTLLRIEWQPSRNFKIWWEYLFIKVYVKFWMIKISDISWVMTVVVIFQVSSMYCNHTLNWVFSRGRSWAFSGVLGAVLGCFALGVGRFWDVSSRRRRGRPSTTHPNLGYDCND